MWYHAGMDSQKVDMIFRLTEQLLLLVILPLVGLLVRRYVKSARTKDAFALMAQHVGASVQRLNKTRRELRDPAKPGQWTEDEAKRLREAALREVRLLLGDSMDVLVDHLGSETKADQAILHSIDAAAESTRPSSIPQEEPARASAPPAASDPAEIPAEEAADADRTSKEPAAQG